MKRKISILLVITLLMTSVIPLSFTVSAVENSIASSNPRCININCSATMNYVSQSVNSYHHFPSFVGCFVRIMWNYKCPIASCGATLGIPDDISLPCTPSLHVYLSRQISD